MFIICIEHNICKSHLHTIISALYTNTLFTECTNNLTFPMSFLANTLNRKPGNPERDANEESFTAMLT